MSFHKDILHSVLFRKWTPFIVNVGFSDQPLTVIKFSYTDVITIKEAHTELEILQYECSEQILVSVPDVLLYTFWFSTHNDV